MTFFLGERSSRNMMGLLPDLVRVVEGAIRISTVDFGVAAPAVRTAAEQAALFRRGVTQLDGYVKKSNHQPRDDGWGHAVDLTPWVRGAFIVTEEAWDYYPAIAAAMSASARAIGLAGRLKWGCNWYETMDRYGATEADMRAAIERYKAAHPGPDFIDGPHFEMA